MPILRDDFVAMLRCPAEHQTLSLADEPLVHQLNAAIQAGRLKNRGGDVVGKPLDGALVRHDGQIAYPIVDGIPVMLTDEAIALDQFTNSAAG